MSRFHSLYIPHPHSPRFFASRAAPSAAQTPFIARHLGDADTALKLKRLGHASLETLMATVGLKPKASLNLPGGCSEEEMLRELNAMAIQPPLRAFLGDGFHATHLPSVIRRLVLNDPAWYTPYTAYQAEAAQGRLEVLWQFQRIIANLMGLPLANASLLDDEHALGEAVVMALKMGSEEGRGLVAVHSGVSPRLVRALQWRLQTPQLERFVQDPPPNAACLVYQLPSYLGDCFQENHGSLDGRGVVHGRGGLKVVKVAVCDPLYACRWAPPGQLGIDLACGSVQRLGLPPGYGGPAAGFLACGKEWIRRLPGRLVGESRDQTGQRAFRLALQTREQHIRREGATSNLCTAQSLPAVLATFYALHHGPGGLRGMAEGIQRQADWLKEMAWDCFAQSPCNPTHFDTLTYHRLKHDAVALAAQHGLAIRGNGDSVSLSLDECCTESELWRLLAVLGGIAPADLAAFQQSLDERDVPFEPAAVHDTAKTMAQQTTNQAKAQGCLERSMPLEWPWVEGEVRLTRYIRGLARKDLGLQDGMIPLGSCTMKLNAASTLEALNDTRWTGWHPRLPLPGEGGYRRLLGQLGSWLCSLMGMEAVWFRPNSGAQGEWYALMAMRTVLLQGGKPRSKCLVPRSAHGTNAASAKAAGLEVIPVPVEGEGRIQQTALQALLAKHGPELACLMLTHPSTSGVFEHGLFPQVVEAVHAQGGFVYLDGANLNAMAGWIQPGVDLKVDCMHVNLHKTLGIPHGGGGPGKGPLGLRGSLLIASEGLLPNLVMADGSIKNYDPNYGFGSASLLPISWAYLRQLGAEGVTRCTAQAILNSHYLTSLIAPTDWPLLSSQFAHEFILDCRPAFEESRITVTDIAKRLLVRL